MSILGNIISSIFGHAGGRPDAQGATQASTKTQGTPSQPPANAAGAQKPTQPASTSQPGGSAAAQAPQVDVARVLDDLAAKNTEKLDWHHSIVDLMKLLGLDSSLAARKDLAQELHYTGNTENSAEMNMWLHKQVMQKLAENGGKVPDSLKH